MARQHIVGDIPLELDDDIDPEDVERYGADSRTDTAVDLAALEAQARADATHEGGSEEYL